MHLFALSFIFIFSFVTTHAQNTQNFCPNFVFEKNMQKGVTGQDVFVLQKILNLDTRTQITKTGPGSKGNETRIFGEKTRAALKKFQALFIEYTVVADGVFQGNTKDLVNDLCNGTGIKKDFPLPSTNTSTNTTTSTDSTPSSTAATSSTTTEVTINLENFQNILNQLPAAVPENTSSIFSRYLNNVLLILYPPSSTTFEQSTSTQPTSTKPSVPQVTVSSVPF